MSSWMIPWWIGQSSEHRRLLNRWSALCSTPTFRAALMTLLISTVACNVVGVGLAMVEIEDRLFASCILVMTMAAFQIPLRWFFFASIVFPKCGSTTLMLRPLKNKLPWFPGFKAEDGPYRKAPTGSATRSDGGLPIIKHSDQSVHSVCGFCSTGCSLEIHLQARKPVHLTPSVHYPVNRGNACPKGWEAMQVLESNERATTPLARNASGSLEAVSWQEAANLFCDRMKSIQSKYGPIHWPLSARADFHGGDGFLGCLAKFGMGIRHGDGNTRQCMATSVVAYKEAFGFDAPPFTMPTLKSPTC